MFQHLTGLGHTHPTIAPLALDIVRQDYLAIRSALDYCEEQQIMIPFKIGNGIYIETLTLYYCGVIKEVGPLHIRLNTASWILRTGRKSTLFRIKTFNPSRFTNDEKKPKTEYIGKCNIPLSAINMWEDWPVEGLPTHSIE